MKIKLSILILIIVILMSSTTTAEGAGISTYHRDRYDAEYKNVHIVVEAPEDGTQVAPGQEIIIRLAMFYNTTNHTNILIYHNDKLFQTVTEEDFYVYEIEISREKNITDVTKFQSPDGYALLELSYPVLLKTASTEYNPYYEDEIQEEQDYFKEELEESKTMRVSRYYGPQIAILTILGITALSTLAWYAPRVTKKRTMLGDMGNIINLFIFIAVILVMLFYLLGIIITLGTGQVSVTDFTYAMLGLLVVMGAGLSFLLQYIISFKLTKLPPVIMLMKMFPDTLSKKWFLVLQPIRRYLNPEGKQCVHVKGLPGQVKYRLRHNKDIHLKVQGDYPIKEEELIYLNGETPLLPVDDWGLRVERPSEAIEEIPDLTEDGESAVEREMEKKTWKYRLFGPKEEEPQYVLDIVPAAYVTRGQATFHALYNHVASEQHKLESRRMYKLVDTLTNYIKYLEKFGVADRLYSLFNLGAFEEAKNTKSFRQVMRKIERRLDATMDEEAKKLTRHAQKGELPA